MEISTIDQTLGFFFVNYLVIKIVYFLLNIRSITFFLTIKAVIIKNKKNLLSTNFNLLKSLLPLDVLSPAV